MDHYPAGADTKRGQGSVRTAADTVAQATERVEHQLERLLQAMAPALGPAEPRPGAVLAQDDRRPDAPLADELLAYAARLEVVADGMAEAVARCQL